MTDIPIKRAVTLMGGTRQLAKAAGVSHQAVGHWLTGARRISPASALLIAAATSGRVAAIELRPDIFAASVALNFAESVAPTLTRGRKE
jgi:DNA-binding transcriptional regulator YdaS (Cro superfamily)